MATIDHQLIGQLINHPPPKEKIITCERHTGFGIRARRGKLTFVYRRKASGRIKTDTLGVLPDTSLSEALQRYQGLRQNAPPVTRASVPTAGNRSALLLSELRDAYLEDKKSRLMRAYRHSAEAAMKTTQYKEVERSLRLLAGFVGNNIPAQDVEREQIYACLNEHKQRYPFAAKRAGKWICAMYNFGRDRFSKDIKFNPADRLKLGVESRKRTRTLTVQEVAELPLAMLHTMQAKREKSDDNALANSKYPLYAIMQLLVLLTGQRGHGVRHMARSGINGSEWILDSRYTKHHQYDEVICLSGPALDLINLAGQITSESPWVFPSSRRPDDPIKRHTLSQSARDTWLLSEGRIQPYSIHDLRRTCATMMARQPVSCPRDLIELVLGHARSGLEQTYVLHGFFEQKAPYQQALADHLTGLWGTSYHTLLGEIRNQCLH